MGRTLPISTLKPPYQNNLTCNQDTYYYDHIPRLTSVVDSGYSRTFQYDEFGNMAVAGSSGVSMNGLTPTSISQINSANNRLNGSQFGYDARGNMTQVGAAVTVGYDAENNVTSTNMGPSTTWIFDAEGQRVQQQVAGGATTVYVHDAFGQLAAEYNSAGVTPGCTTCYLMYDQLGSLRTITDQNGNIVGRHDYLPYGEEIPNGTANRNGVFASAANLTQMFTGQERDGGTAVLDYFNARHMSAALGRFMQADPGNAGADLMNPRSWHGYGYVTGNPLVLVDPSGMQSGSPCEINTACEGQIPGCLGNFQACFQKYFAPDPLQVWDPLALLTTPSGYYFADGLRAAYDNIIYDTGATFYGEGTALTGPFKNLDCAGYTAARSILSQTQAQGIEWGGFVYKSGQSNSYFFATSFSGTPAALPSFDFHRRQDTPSGFSLAAWYHFHPRVVGYPHPEPFSGEDLGATRRVGGPGYLLTPAGTVLKLLPYPPSAPVAPTLVFSSACKGG